MKFKCVATTSVMMSDFELTTNLSGDIITEKSQEGELTMFRYCFNVVDNKSGNGMPKRTIGLALSYSFLR